jgi:hypothetical protein
LVRELPEIRSFRVLTTAQIGRYLEGWDLVKVWLERREDWQMLHRLEKVSVILLD